MQKAYDHHIGKSAPFILLNVSQFSFPPSSSSSAYFSVFFSGAGNQSVPSAAAQDGDITPQVIKTQ